MENSFKMKWKNDILEKENDQTQNKDFLTLFSHESPIKSRNIFIKIKHNWNIHKYKTKQSKYQLFTL